MLAPLSLKILGKPFKFDLTFDHLSTTPPTWPLWYYFITDVNDNSTLTTWPVSGFISTNEYETVPNGFRFSFDPIQLVDEFPNYPSGSYKVVIVGNLGGNFWVWAGGYQNYVNNYTFTFTFNDFCSDCGDGIYYGHDNDGDGILEFFDNCPNVANASQSDVDNDGIGDVCDPQDNRDIDNDGVFNNVDNCPNNPNPNQADQDNDGIGDVCDTQDNRDTDGDGVENFEDNCPNEAGPSSNNGCPANDPAFVIVDKVQIKERDEFTGNLNTIYDSSDSDNDSPPTIRNNGEYDFVVTLKNTGDLTANSTFLTSFYSFNSSFSFFGDCIWDDRESSTDLSSGNTFEYSFTELIGGNSIGICDLATGTRYFYFLPGPNGQDDSTAFQVQFSYTQSSSGKGPVLSPTGFQSKARINSALILEQYPIEIYDLMGRKVVSKEVSSIMEETDAVMSLPTGLYIIKSEKGDRKMYVPR